MVESGVAATGEAVNGAKATDAADIEIMITMMTVSTLARS